MKNLSLYNIAEVCDGRMLKIEDESVIVTDVVIDSRKVTPGCLFVAIKGNRVDGHDFIDQAIRDGAVAVISENKLRTGQPHIWVDSSLQALKDIANYYMMEMSCKVVGITGSVGKTTTKEMIASVLSEKYKVLKTEGNFNNEIGLPLTVFRIREEHEIAVLEMGISDFGEMKRLSRIAKPDVCVFTNIGQCHLENLYDRNGILKAKTEMLMYMKPDGKIVLNGDDDKLASVREYNGIIPITYGIDDEKCSYTAAEIVQNGLSGIHCTVHCQDGRNIPLEIHVPGRHMIYNALAATAVGEIFGLTDEEIASGIAKFVPVTGRNHTIEANNMTVIDDCYNANPVSMKASLDVLAMSKKEESKDGRRVAILGDMLELGNNEGLFHREIGDYLVRKNLELAVLVGPRMKEAYDEAKSFVKCMYFDTTQDVMDHLREIVREGDTVLVKASNGMKFAQIVEELTK